MNWNDYEGREIGEWLLDSYLGERDGKAFFTTHRGKEPKQYWLQLLPREADNADAALASWNIARELAHEHLLRPYASGEALLGGVGVHYAVLDLPDDDLSEVLSKGHPGRTQARSILAGVDSGLKYLHARGLSHGSVTPSSVFLLPGAVKLSVDTLRSVGDTDADLRQFGALRAQLGVKDTLGNHRKAIALGVAIVVLLLIVFFLVRQATEPAPVAKAEWPKVTHPAAVVVPKQTPLGPPIGQTRAPIAGKTSSSGASSGTSSGTSWGIVAATYRDYGIADKYATVLRKRMPQLKVHVSPPDGQGKLYLVVLGSGLTRDQADALRNRAASMGAPRDSYVTKLDEP